MSEPCEPCFSDQNKLHFVSVFTGSTDNGKLKVLHDSFHQIFTTTELVQTVVIENSWEKKSRENQRISLRIKQVIYKRKHNFIFPTVFLLGYRQGESWQNKCGGHSIANMSLEQTCGPFKSVVTVVVCSCHSKSSYLFVLLSYNCNCLWRKCGIGGEETLDGCVCVSVCKDDKPHTFSLICRRQTYMYHKGPLKPFGSIYNPAEHALSLAYIERICSL